MSSQPAFRIHLSKPLQRDKCLVQLFKLALRKEFALVAPPPQVPPRARRQKWRSHLVAVAFLDTPYFRRIQKTDPDRIIGVYHFNGDHVGLLQALMEDIADAAARVD